MSENLTTGTVLFVRKSGGKQGIRPSLPRRSEPRLRKTGARKGVSLSCREKEALAARLRPHTHWMRFLLAKLAGMPSSGCAVEACHGRESAGRSRNSNIYA